MTLFLQPDAPADRGGLRIYVAQPPLFSTLVGTTKVYLKDEFARQQFLDEHPNHNKEFQRLKGLGEMDWDRRFGDNDDGRRQAHAAPGHDGRCDHR